MRKSFVFKPSLASTLHRCKAGLGLALIVVFVLMCGAARAASDRMLADAVHAMQDGKWSYARKLVTGAGDPLGQKLYLWMYFREEDNAQADFSALAHFIKHNPDWPGQDRMREGAEKNMPEDLGAGEILSWFDQYPPLTAKGLDRYLEALLISGRKDKAQQEAGAWWASKLSTRDEQKMIYYKYGALIDRKAHRRRLDMLLFSRQYTNARAVAEVLGAGYLQLAEARIALAEEKIGVSGLIAKVPNALKSDPGLAYERLKWRRKKDLDSDALYILHHPPPVEDIQNPEDWWKEQHIIIRRLMEKRMYESAYLLAVDHFQTKGVAYAEAEWLAGWLALRYMQRPTEAYERFEKLYSKVETPISRARAAYWAGRAAEGFGQQELAKEWYRKAAKHQTVFYGQLAGVKLGLGEVLPNAAPPSLSAGDKAGFENNDLVRAARVFNEAGLDGLTGAFIDAFVDSEKSPKAYRFGAELAGKLGDTRDALKIAKEATKEGMFLTAQAFPVITDRLKDVNTEWALVHAIIRQESMFDTQAQSPAGALGLMQLMPGTAKQLAKECGLRPNAWALTSNPSYNILLGTTYLDQLLDRFDGYYPMAIAAYNAGPARMKQWIHDFGDPRKGEIDAIDWMELIPVSETRNYVQRVLESVYIYRLRLKDVQKPPTHPIHIAMAEKTEEGRGKKKDRR